jgi:hypothetical protein
MNLIPKLSTAIRIEEQPWALKKFLGFFFLYIFSFLLIALPDGGSTLLAPYGVANSECVEKRNTENVTKDCSPTLWLTARSTPTEYIKFFGSSDPGSYVKGGMLLAGKDGPGLSESTSRLANLATLDRLKLMNKIGFGMWPPGMFILNSFPVNLSDDVPLGLFHVFVSTALWAIAFAIITSLLAIHLRTWFAITIPFFIVALGLFHNYFFRYGAMYSETYGTSLMVIGFTFIFLALYRKPNCLLLFTAGLVFAIAAFVRSQVLPVAVGLTFVLVSNHLLQVWRLKNHKLIFNNSLKPFAILSFLIGFYLPIGTYMITNDGALFHADYMWEYPFKVASYPNAGAANFTALGGVRAACEVDLKRCEEIRIKIKDGEISASEAKEEVIRAFIHHPISFSTYKLPIAWQFWMNDSDNNFFSQGIFIFILSVGSLLCIFLLRLWLLAGISIVTFALLFAPPFLIHFESRYFYMMKIYFVFLPLWILMISFFISSKKYVSEFQVNDPSSTQNFKKKKLFTYLVNFRFVQQIFNSPIYQKLCLGINSASISKLFKHKFFWISIVYFLTLLAVTLLVRDIPNQPDALHMTLQQLINTSMAMGDPSSFSTAAIDVARNGWISDGNNWIFSLWPPGFILLQALILKLFGFDAPVIFILQILSACLFAIVLTFFYDFLRTKISKPIAFIFPLFIFAFPVSRVFLLQPTGISLGESFAVGFFILSLLLAFRSLHQNSLRYAFFSGLCLALSAYFRSQFEFILLVMTAWGILWGAYILLTSIRSTFKRTVGGGILTMVISSISITSRLVRTSRGFFVAIAFKKKQLQKPALVNLILTVAVILLTAHAITLPWRLYHLVHDGSPSWVHTTSIIASNSVMTSDALEQAKGGFVVAGGGNLVCRIDNSTCGDTTHAMKLFVKTFISHPIQWYSLKLEIIGNFWFSSIQDWVTPSSNNSTFMNTLGNGLALLALIIIVSLLFTKTLRSHKLWSLLVWFNLSLFSAYIFIFTAAHFEVRYFYFPKIAALFMLIAITALYFHTLTNRPKS